MFTAALMVTTVASFVVRPGIELRRGTIEQGTRHSVRFSYGAMTYVRSVYISHVLYTPEYYTDQQVQARAQKIRWSSHLLSEWVDFQDLRMNPGQSSGLQLFIPGRPHQSAFSVPLVSMSVLFLMLSRLVFLSNRRRRRVLAGCCGGCGYSLAGLDGGACPECGEGTK